MRRRFRDCGFYSDVKEKTPPINLPATIGDHDADLLPDEIRLDEDDEKDGE